MQDSARREGTCVIYAAPAPMAASKQGAALDFSIGVQLQRLTLLAPAVR